MKDSEARLHRKVVAPPSVTQLMSAIRSYSVGRRVQNTQIYVGTYPELSVGTYPSLFLGSI